MSTEAGQLQAPEMQAMEALIERGGLRAFLDWPLQDLRA